MISERYRQILDRQLVARTFVGQVLRKMRRFYLGNFKPEYIQQAIAETRTGECHRCGACCELIYRCPFLGKDSENLSYCRVYGDLRPANCHNYPFDIKDSEIDRCGFRFKKLGSPEEAMKIRSQALVSGSSGSG